MMNERGKSDRPVVPQKPPNKADAPEASAAEVVEGRGLAEGNPQKQNSLRAQHRTRLTHALERIRTAIERDSKMRLSSLWHHVCDVDRLRAAYCELNPRSAPGIDGQRWHEYGSHLEENLPTLSEKLRRGCYRAKAVRRHYIPKADGRQRPSASQRCRTRSSSARQSKCSIWCMSGNSKASLTASDPDAGSMTPWMRSIGA